MFAELSPKAHAETKLHDKDRSESTYNGIRVRGIIATRYLSKLTRGD